MTRKVVSLFDNFIKLAGASYLFLTIVAFIDLKIYYSKFRISINEYISVSEILFSALDKIIIVFLALFLQLVIWLYVFGYVFDYDSKEQVEYLKNDSPINDDNETINRSLNSKTLRLLWLIIGTLAIISAVLSLIYPKVLFLVAAKDFFLLNFWMAMCLYMMWLQTTRILWKAWRKKIRTAKAIITLIVFVSVLLMSIWVKNTLLFKRVYKHGSQKQIVVILKDNSVIKPNDTLRYVGQTEKYFFYWNKVTAQVTIYPSGEVRRIFLK